MKDVKSIRTNKFNSPKNLSPDGYLKRYDEIFSDATDLQKQFAKDMFNLIINDEDTSKITTISAPCGIGKSTTIKALVNYCAIGSNNKWRDSQAIGLVIVTDQLERLAEYHTLKKAADTNDVYDYSVVQHKNYCTYISSKDKLNTASKLLIKSQYQPIVLLSTQKYFQMPDDQRERLFTYRYIDRRGNSESFARRIVIFDEKPYFYSTKTIQFSNINDVLSALQEGIPSTDPNKAWVIEQYQNFRTKIEKVLLEKERLTSTHEDIFYWNDKNSLHLTSNDKKFFEIIEGYKREISRIKHLAYADLFDFKRLISEGAFFITTRQTRGQDYQTRFELLTDNKEKFYINRNKAKFFVLDATADIDPDYQVPYVKLVDTSQYRRSIPLTITQINVNTSKSQIAARGQSMKMIDAIKRDMWSRVEINENLLVATYMKIRELFEGKDTSVVHFGRIKGSNEFHGVHKMAHIGLNRSHHFVYFLLWLSKNPMAYEALKHMDEAKSRQFISDRTKQVKGLFPIEEMNQIMFRSILADFEQNIFRTAIRDFNNAKPVEIFAYWDSEKFSDLNILMEERYIPLGANIEYCTTPAIIEQAKVNSRQSANGEMTVPQKILEWYDNQPKGKVFKIAEMLAATGTNYDRFKKIRKTNQAINNIFANAQVSRGIYKVS